MKSMYCYGNAALRPFDSDKQWKLQSLMFSANSLRNECLKLGLLFSLFYETSLGLPAKSGSQLSSWDTSCQVSTGSPRRPCLTRNPTSTHWPRAATWPILGSTESLSRKCEAMTGSQLASLCGWLELEKELRVIHAFLHMKARLWRMRDRQKTTKADPRQW